MIRIEHLRADVFELDALTRAALSGQHEIPGFHVARKLEQITRPDDLLVPDERAHLARWLEARVSEYEPPVAVLDNIRSLASPSACFVVCGQQPGLCCSPLLVIWKALQAVRLAQELTSAWGTPVVPMFWNHADDHDVAEVHHANFVNPNFDVHKVTLSNLSSGRVPVSRIEFDDARHGLPAIRELLRQVYGYTPRIDEALELFVPRHGETFATAFTRSLFDLLGHLGLVVLEPDWIREDLSHHLAALVGADLSSALERGERQVEAAGYEVAIESREAALLYRVDAAGREPLRLGGDGFAYDQEPGSRTNSELAAEIVQDPANWSAGALLRPLVQDLALPVAAYVGGPGELAYHAQLAGTRAALGLPATPFVPRISVTLIDADNEASLTKLDANLTEVLSARGEFNGEAQGSEESRHGEQLRALAKETRRRMLELRSELAAQGSPLAGIVKRTANKVDELISKLGDKVSRSEANHSGKGHRHLRRVNNTLAPRGRAQERILGPLPFVASYGRSWIDELVGELDPFASEHHAVFLGDPLQRERPVEDAETPNDSEE